MEGNGQVACGGSYVYRHALFIDHASDPILYQNIRAIGSKAISTITNLRHDLGIPFPLCLAAGDETGHNKVVYRPPVAARARCNMGDDVCVRSASVLAFTPSPTIQSWHMTDWTFGNLDNVFFAALGRVVVEICFTLLAPGVLP
jgi:hypothetical protein